MKCWCWWCAPPLTTLTDPHRPSWPRALWALPSASVWKASNWAVGSAGGHVNPHAEGRTSLWSESRAPSCCCWNRARLVPTPQALLFVFWPRVALYRREAHALVASERCKDQLPSPLLQPHCFLELHNCLHCVVSCYCCLKRLCELVFEIYFTVSSISGRFSCTSTPSPLVKKKKKHPMVLSSFDSLKLLHLRSLCWLDKIIIGHLVSFQSYS